MIVTNTKSFFQNVTGVLSEFKATYCPDGQTCQDIATLGGLMFTLWFMYIALEPIIRF
jgi:hypothetical protein